MGLTFKRLPDSELEVMQAIWQLEPPVSRSAIDGILSKTHQLAPTTLLTLLSRLADKGCIEIRKEGRSAVYNPLVSQADYQASQSKRFVDQLFGSDMAAFANALTSSGLSREDLKELRRLLEEDAL